MAVNWMRERKPPGGFSGIRPVSTAPRVLRVLIVDYEQSTSGGLARLVRRWGHATRTARDVPAALRVAAVQRPDVVVLSLDLPGLNGCRAARQLRRDMANKSCLLIAVTGWADGNRRQHGIEAGIDLLLIAPVPPAILETLLLLECVHVNRPRPASGSETIPASDSPAMNDLLLKGRLPQKFHAFSSRKANINEN